MYNIFPSWFKTTVVSTGCVFLPIIHKLHDPKEAADDFCELAIVTVAPSDDAKDMYNLMGTRNNDGTTEARLVTVDMDPPLAVVFGK